MKGKKIIKSILSMLCLVIVMTAINTIIQVSIEGMWLLGIPRAEDVTSVTIKYPSVTEEQLEITDREQIETCVHLSGFLKYKPFVNADEEDTPLITVYYHLTNGNQVEVSANTVAVFYNGKRHVLKDDNSFVKFVEVLFFSQFFAPAS